MSRPDAYVVLADGMSAHESRASTSRGVLFLGRTTTLFRTLRAAREAVNRTMIYARKRGFDWKASDYIIEPARWSRS